MRIGIYKVGTSIISFCNDTNGRFKEVKMLASVIKDKGHEVHIIVKDSIINDIIEYDKIFVLNGVFDEDGLEEDYVRLLRKQTGCLSYILTDLRLKPPKNLLEGPDKFDYIFTQTKQKLFPEGILEAYSGMPELALYKMDMEKAYNSKREYDFIFGGGIRNRSKDFKNYVLQIADRDFLKSVVLMKDEEKGIDTRVCIDKYYEMLYNSKTSVIIADEEYNDVGFITWRFFENLSKGVISIVDNKFDKYDIIKKNIPKDFIIEDYLGLFTNVLGIKVIYEKGIDIGTLFIMKFFENFEKATDFNRNDLISGNYTYQHLFNITGGLNT